MTEPLPLDGIRVLDLTRLLPGPYCTLLLADLGADVVKVEPPGGDPLRTLGSGDGEASAYFKAVNRNKRSMTLNLRAAGALDVLHALVARVDVVVEGFRPETARAMGVDAAALMAVNPRLVHCAITGFGQRGAYAERPAHDINYVALSGLLALDHPELMSARPASDTAPQTTEPSHRSRARAPQPSRTFLADIGGGAMVAAIGILAALLRNARTGKGTSIDASMHDGCLAWLTFPAARTLAAGDETMPVEAPFNSEAACYNVYETSDGRWMALGALEPKFWQRFCERIGRPDLVDRQYAPEQRDVADAIAAVVKTRSRADWMEAFADVDACLTPVNSVHEALQDPHGAERGSVGELAGVRYVRSPVRLSAGAPLQAIELPDLVAAPSLGAHTDAVLEMAGFSQADRDRLQRQGII